MFSGEVFFFFFATAKTAKAVEGKKKDLKTFTKRKIASQLLLPS